MNHTPKQLVEDYCESKKYGQSHIEAIQVWHCYILGNQKWLFAVIIDGEMKDLYFEVTFNKAKSEFYIDEYKKVENRCVLDNED